MEFLDKKCKEFSATLAEWRINHEVFNDGYHIQVQRIHNFYPSKGSYYNSDTGKKSGYSFSNAEDFFKFLADNTPKDQDEEVIVEFKDYDYQNQKINPEWLERRRIFELGKEPIELSEYNYCLIDAKGLLKAATKILGEIIPQNVPLLNTDEFTDARAVIFKYYDILFKEVKTKSE